MHITYCKIDGFIRVCGGEFRHLVLFDHGLFDEIYDKIKHLTSEKSSTINLNFGEIRIDSCNSLPNEKFLNFYNAITVTKSVVNKNKNEYYYNIFVGKRFL